MGGGGGFIQLVAHGVQDIVLSGNPQITFFKTVYRRSTNYAMDSIKQEYLGTNPKLGKYSTIKLSRNGDLLKSIWIEYSPQDVLSGPLDFMKYEQPILYTYPFPLWITANLANTLIKSTTLIIGGQEIDTIYGAWMTLWQSISEKNHLGIQGMPIKLGQEPGIYNTASTQDPNVCTKSQLLSYNHRAFMLDLSGTINAPNKAWIKIPFWFSNNPGLALPLIGLQYTDIFLKIQYTDWDSYTGTPPGMGLTKYIINNKELSNLVVWCDYIFLDKTERQLFAENNHEYLIEQHWKVAVSKPSDKIIDLSPINQSVKEIFWAHIGPTIPGNSPAGPSSPFTSLYVIGVNGTYKLTINGKELCSSRGVEYYTRLQVNKHHKGYGSILCPDSIGVFCWSLHPEDYQPSGSINISRLNTLQLVSKSSYQPYYTNIFCNMYNIFRIEGGQGGVVFNN